MLCGVLGDLLLRRSVALSELLSHSEPTTTSAQEDCWALVQRVASSRHLLKAPQLREILLYLSRRVLTDNPAAISEQEIGCKVLGRRPDFNPNEDNIVRVQVRHLRKKLDEYFSSEGREEPVVLTIPKGAYLPHFEARSAQPLPPAVAPGADAEPPARPATVAPTAAPAVKSAPSRRVVMLVAAALTALVFTSLILWRQKEALRRAPAPEESQPARPDPLWSRIFAPGRQTSIVVADTCLVMLQDLLDVDIPLSEYVTGGYPLKLVPSVPDPQLRAALELIASRQYTSFGDTNTAARVMDMSRRFGAQTNLRYSRYMTLREFKMGNFVLIGSRRGVPWVQLFEPRLNFSMEEDHASRQFHFRNQAPLPGEQAVYGVTRDGGNNQQTYADIALVPNTSGNGVVLLLSGINMEATEAAGELVTSPDFPAVLTGWLKSRAGQPPASYIEILLQVKAMAGTTQSSKIVAHRLLSGQRPAS
jgi:hypothetical protein